MLFRSPADIIINVGGKAKLPAGADHTRQFVEECLINNPPLALPTLRPRVGIEEKDSIKAGLRERIQHVSPVTAQQPDIRDVLGLDRTEQFRNAIEKRFNAQISGLRMRSRHRSEMFTATKADFEKNPGGFVRKLSRRAFAQFFEIDRDLREQLLDAVTLPGAQGLAFGTPIKLPARGCRAG